jgi:hypothetical protein
MRSDDHWSLTCAWTNTSKATTDASTLAWCATRAGRTLSCQVRALREGPGWEVVMKTGVDTMRPHWFVRWFRGEDRRLVDCQRESRTLLLVRRCADEATARFVTEILRQDYVSAGWRVC